jgi:hypothetical protein
MDKWRNRRPTYCCTNRWISRLADGQRTDRLLDRKTGEWKDKIQRQMDNQIDRQKDKLLDRETDRKSDTKTGKWTDRYHNETY